MYIRRVPVTGGLVDMLTYRDTHESMYTRARAHTHIKIHYTHRNCMLSNLGKGLVKLVIFTVSDVLRTFRRGRTNTQCKCFSQVRRLV